MLEEILPDQFSTSIHPWAYFQLAEQVLRHLALLGSGITKLNFRPPGDHVIGRGYQRDCNGHLWPFDSYERGILSRYEGQQFVKVVAIPVPVVVEQIDQR